MFLSQRDSPLLFPLELRSDAPENHVDLKYHTIFITPEGLEVNQAEGVGMCYNSEVMDLKSEEDR